MGQWKGTDPGLGRGEQMHVAIAIVGEDAGVPYFCWPGEPQKVERHRVRKGAGSSSGEKEGGGCMQKPRVGVWGPIRNGDPKELGAVAWAGARRWTRQGRGVILETADPRDQDLKKELGVKREGSGGCGILTVAVSV